jgi:hypothetical protein
MFKGTYENYYWVEWEVNDHFLRGLLSQFPQIVLGKYLVNTSFDSGSLMLADEEIAQGWYKHNDLAISPSITDVLSIPYDQYDEWYVFNSPKTFDNYEVFVNYGGFSLHDSAFAEIQERFWQQLGYISPETFLAEGDFLICVTKDAKLFNLLNLLKTVLKTPLIETLKGRLKSVS